MLLTLVRHSESKVDPHSPITSWGLSDRGKELADKLSATPEIGAVDVIYSSSQPKAVETAEIVLKNRDIDRKIDGRLTEISSFTKKFVTLEELEKNTKDYFSGKVERLFNGESKDEAIIRFNQAISDIVEAERKQSNVGIISHGAMLALFAGQYLDRSVMSFLPSMRQPDVAVLDWNSKKFLKFFG